MPESRCELSEALLLAGYVFYQKPRTLSSVAHELKKKRWLWRTSRGTKTSRQNNSGSFVAGCMLDMAGITERTYSYMQELYNAVEQLFRERPVKHKFWNNILESSADIKTEVMSWCM